MTATNVLFGGDYGIDVDYARWVAVYPPYLDSTLSVSKGRKISKECSVDNPRSEEIFEVCKSLGLKTVLEMDKAYPKNYWVRGRTRICLFDSDGNALNADIPSRKALYAKISQGIPKYREKQNKNKSNNSNSNKNSQGKTGANNKPSGKRKKKGKR